MKTFRRLLPRAPLAKTVLATMVFVVASAFSSVASAVPAPRQVTSPRLEFLIDEDQKILAERLSRIDPQRYLAAMALVGLDDPGPPIPVHLALENSLLARRAPSWVVGYVMNGRVVLLPHRVPGYPDREIETVLVHEVLHVLIDRAAGGHPVPRWFHEGVALYGARDWGLEDRSRLLWATWNRGESALAALDQRFTGSSSGVSGAYAFAGAFVRFVVDRHGPGAPADVLAGIADGLPFNEAFQRATGLGLDATEASFFRYLDLWNRWVPLLTSSTTLWILISALAVIAFKRRRDRDAELIEQWEEEELRRFAEEPADGWVN